MADNTTLDPGTGGDVIATDDVGGVKYQRVKLVNGTLDATDAIGGDATNGLDVDVTRLPALVAGTANIGDVDVLTLPNVTNGGTFAVQDSEKVVDNAAFTDGTTKVQPSGYIFDEAAGTALTENDAAAARIDSKRAQIGVIEDATTRGQRAAVSAANALKVDGSAVTQPVSLATLPVTNAGTFAVQNAPQAQTTGGLTIGPATGAKLLSAASTNATSVKASAGQVYGWYLYNSNAAVRFVKLYNKASAPTVGTDVPVLVIPIPPGAAANVEFHMGIVFATGIALATTTGVADADTGAVAANEIVINLLFK